MADQRFFRLRGPFSLAELASLADARLEQGDASKQIRDVAALDAAAEGHVTFLDNPKYIDQAKHTKADACVIRQDMIEW
ncbi:MAG: LpxD N-terminal domain-containing protein, partial [Pseudomonadota bacterium]